MIHPSNGFFSMCLINMRFYDKASDRTRIIT